MKRKFILAISLALAAALTFASLALAAVPPRVTFTADAPCPVNVLVLSYTDPAGQAGKTAFGSTPWTLETFPATQVTFFYPAFVVCGGVTYNFVSASPSSPLTSGAEDSTITVTGRYAISTPSDTTPPELTLPSDLTVSTLNALGTVVDFTASANDAVDGPIPVTCSPASGSLFPVGQTTVNCSAQDTAGNTANGSFTVTVNLIADNTPPTVTVPADITAEATGPTGASVTFSASANDDVDGALTPVCAPASGSTFALGATPVTCSATDAAGNTGSAAFTVTVVDTTPPALSLPGDLTVPAQNAFGAVVDFTASAFDLVEGSRPVTCFPASGSQFPIGQTTVNCSVSDSRDNVANGSFIVSVQYAAAGNKCKGIPGHQILQPINADGSSVFKAGSTVPAKFRVCGADGDPISDPDVVTSFRLVQIIHDGNVSDVDQEVLSTTPNTVFRIGSQQWIFDISTRDLAADQTYVYLITLKDGSAIQFQFALK